MLFVGQTFGEGVRGLVSGGGVVCEDNLSAFNLLPEEMVTYFDVFRTTIEFQVPGDGDGGGGT